MPFNFRSNFVQLACLYTRQQIGPFFLFKKKSFDNIKRWPIKIKTAISSIWHSRWGCGYNEESFCFVFYVVYFFLRISSVTIFSRGIVSFLAGGLNESRPTPSRYWPARDKRVSRFWTPQTSKSTRTFFFVNNSVSLPTRFIDDRSFFSIQFTEDFLGTIDARWGVNLSLIHI